MSYFTLPYNNAESSATFCVSLTAIGNFKLLTNLSQRERSRSPRRGRSRSPGRSGRRRSYTPRSRSRSRDEYRRVDRRSRSPMTGAGAPAGGSVTGSGFGAAPQRSFEERAAAREQMMSNIRDASQQDRRVYVGNLSYDVKWHHLKDFMRQGESFSHSRSN